jgi:hypothetical protein
MRSMQIESTLFGVLVIQVKPHLERVLNLPPDSLTKEIALTQSLLTLLLEHEIPSDLLSFSASSSAMDKAGKLLVPLEAVRGHVSAMRSMIDEAKVREAAEREQQKRYDEERVREQERDEEIVYSSASTAAGMGGGAPRMMRTGGRTGGGRTAGGPEMMMKGGFDAPEMMAAASLSAMPEMYSADEMYSANAAAAATAAARARDSSEGTATSEDHEDASDREHTASGPGGAPPADADEEVDYTAIVNAMDGRIERLDQDGVLRPTIINVGSQWIKKRRQGLLGGTTTQILSGTQQRDEKTHAFGLLDALTRGGGLALQEVSLHVVVSATHQFDKSVMQTLVQDNVNPIDRVEQSALILASCVHRVPIKQLLRGTDWDRISSSTPALLEE